MRIRIDDDFDNDLDAQYKSVDNDTIVGNGALSKENIPIIDVKSEDIKEELVDGEMENGSIRQKEITEYNLDNGFSIKIQGATLLDENEIKNYINNNSGEDRKNKSMSKNGNNRIKENDEYIGQRVKGKIIVGVRLGDRRGKLSQKQK